MAGKHRRAVLKDQLLWSATVCSLPTPGQGHGI